MMLHALVFGWLLLAAFVVYVVALGLSRVERKRYVRGLYAMRIDTFGVIGGPRFARCKACGKVHPYTGQPVKCECGADV